MTIMNHDYDFVCIPSINWIYNTACIQSKEILLMHIHFRFSEQEMSSYILVRVVKMDSKHELV